MKRLVGITALICLLAQLTLTAQVMINITRTDEIIKTEPIDDALFSVQYETSFLPDTLSPDKRLKETMMLKAGRICSSYYSYAAFLRDSAMTADREKGAGMDVIRENAMRFQSMINYKVYKNYPAGKVTMLDQVAMNSYRCEEENESPAWELHDETMEVISYTCHKATCRFRGRDYTAWFTPEIPRSEGPWKLHGLPGLILKAEDSKGHYTFEATGIVQAGEEEKILFGANGFEPISRKNLNKMHERNTADPVGFAKASNPNMQIIIKGPDGEEMRSPKNMPFNPIELEEK